MVEEFDTSVHNKNEANLLNKTIGQISGININNIKLDDVFNIRNNLITEIQKSASDFEELSEFQGKE
jgi:hypothetical protein